MQAHESTAEFQPANPSRTSTSLLEAAKANRPGAWPKLVELYGPFVYGWCRHWGIEPGDAHDLVQEVFQAVAGNIERFNHEQPGSSFHGWVWTIARNASCKYFAARSRRPTAVGGSEMQARLGQVPSPPEEPTEDCPPVGQKAACMRRALEMIRGDFQPQTWHAFWRNVVDGRPLADVAQEFGLTKGAVRQARYRVLTRLREQFGQLID